jgi:hypothetical protein
MRKLLPIFFLCFAAKAFGVDASGATGMTSFKLLRGARPAGMAGAFSAVADDVNALYYNPAGLNELRDVQITASHMEWLDGIRNDDVAMGMPIYGRGAWGLGASYLYAQDEGRDNWGNSTGQFTDFDFSMQAAFSMQLGDRAGAGVVYKIYRQGYDSNFNMGSAFDLGTRAAFFNRRLVLALGAANLGTTAALGGFFAPLPSTLKAGAAWHFVRDWVLDVDYSHEPVNFLSNWRFGTEYSMELSETISAAFRAGYVIGPSNAQGGLAGLSTGLGVRWSAVQVDYAFAPQGDLGNSHRVSLSYDFGQR